MPRTRKTRTAPTARRIATVARAVEATRADTLPRVKPKRRPPKGSRVPPKRKGARPLENERDPGLCDDPTHLHCTRCGCPMTRLGGEPARSSCVRCDGDGHHLAGFDVLDFAGRGEWPAV